MRDETIIPDGPGAVPVAYRDFGGTGTPVVLLHGLGGTVADWNRFATRLRDRGGHPVVAVDLRGHGHTGDGPWTWDAVLDDVEAEAFAELTAAWRRGLGESLDRLTARRPDLRVRSIKASHAMLVERPEVLADVTMTMLPD